MLKSRYFCGGSILAVALTLGAGSAFAQESTVVEEVVVGNALLGVVRLLRIFEQDARLQLRPLVLANPGEFEFWILYCHTKSTLMETRLVEQDAVMVFRILDQLVVGEDFYVSIASGQGREISFVICGPVIASEYLSL